MDDLTWKCHICDDIRPDNKISVYTSDISDTSAENNLPRFMMQQNVRYCNDRQSCIDGSKTFSFTKKKKIPKADEIIPMHVAYFRNNMNNKSASIVIIICVIIFILIMTYIFLGYGRIR